VEGYKVFASDSRFMSRLYSWW